MRLACDATPCPISGCSRADLEDPPNPSTWAHFAIGGDDAYRRAAAVPAGSPVGGLASPCSSLTSLQVKGLLQPAHPIFGLVPNLDVFLQMQAKCKVITKASRIQVLTLSLHKVSASQRCEGRTEPPSSVGSSRDAESTCPSSRQLTVQHHAHLFPCSWCSSS